MPSTQEKKIAALAIPAVEEKRGDDQAWKRAENCVIDKARLGDARSLELLWMRFEPKIHAFFRQMCRHYYLTRSDDAWGEVYIAVAASIRSFDPAKARSTNAGAAFCNWAYRITARVAVGQLLRERKLTAVEVSVDNWESISESALVDPGDGLVDRLIQRETVNQIYEKLSAEENPKRAHYLRLVAEGAPQQEAAALVGINPSTGRSWLNRLRADLEIGREDSIKV